MAGVTLWLKEGPKMKHYLYGQRAQRSRSNTTPALGLLLLGLLLALTLASSAGAAATAVPLGAADSFAVLAGSAITNTGPTTINGDVGVYPTITETGFGAATVNGTNHAGDGVTQQAKTDLVVAYGNAAGQGPTSPISADLGGQTLTPGVYNSGSSIGLTGTLTLDAAGDPNAVFVFQAGSTLTTASASAVNLVNGAQSCNVFWQVGSDATLGTGSTFRGTVIALTSITVTTGVTVDGRVLARNGAVTLDNDTITASHCATTASSPVGTPDREIYCDAAGKAYDLIAGENLLPPWNALGLVLGYTNPVTGEKSCNFPAVAPTPTTPTPTTPAPTPTPPVTPAPTPKPTPKPTPRPAPAAGSGGTTGTSGGVARRTPAPAVHAFGLTG